MTKLAYKHNAKQANTVDSMEAFAYSTLEQTTRTRHVAKTTGNAYYAGMT